MKSWNLFGMEDHDGSAGLATSLSPSRVMLLGCVDQAMLQSMSNKVKMP